MDKQAKRALKEKFAKRAVIGGVYRIRCGGNHAEWLRATTDLQGSENRFNFSVANNSCIELCMAKEWKAYGASAFSFEVLEAIQLKDTQTEREFQDDVDTLLELWNEKCKVQSARG